MEQQLREIVARIAEVAGDFPLTSHMRDDLNVDSFRAVEIIFEVERLFSIKVPDGRYSEVQTFEDLLKLIQSIKG